MCVFPVMTGDLSRLYSISQSNFIDPTGGRFTLFASSNKTKLLTNWLPHHTAEEAGDISCPHTLSMGDYVQAGKIMDLLINK